MNNIKDRIAVIKKEGYALDFGRVFEHAFENYKKIALYGGLVIFVFFFVISLIVFGLLASFLGGAAFLEFFKPENLQVQNFGMNTLLIISAASILIGSLLSPFTAGLIKMAYCAENDEEFHVSTMFEFYKPPFFKELFIATFLLSLVSSLLSTVLNYAEIPLLNLLVSLFISLFTIMTIPLIIFGKLSAIEAIEASFTIVSKQPLIILGLLIVSGIGVLIGFIGCCIGIFFTIPFMYSLYYALYSNILGFESDSNNITNF
jgi:MFS family permease